MRNSLRIGGIALALGAGMGLAAAQGQKPPGMGEKPSGLNERSHTPPGAATQPKNPVGDLSKPAAVTPAEDATAGQVTEQVPGATPQTMPSTISAENAALDKLPTVALQLPLSDEQKSKIAASLGKASVAPVGNVQATVAQSLPTGVMLQEFPADATAAVPDVSRYKYVKLSDRVLIVDPLFSTVVGEIKN
jgi:hypothetical protein